MKITRINLHTGAAFAFVLYCTLYTAFVTHDNVAAAFFVTGLLVLSSFSDKTRWLFYILLIPQAWSNWHWIGLIAAIVFIVYCVRRSLIYENVEPSLGNILKAIVDTLLKQPFLALYSVLLFMLRMIGRGATKSKSERQLEEEERERSLHMRQEQYLAEDPKRSSLDPNYPNF